MPTSSHFPLWGYLCASVLVIVRYGYIAATDSPGPRRGRSRLIATLAFASWFIVPPLMQMAYEAHSPVFEFDGVISSVEVRNSSSKNFSAQLSIETTTGGDVMVHVSDRSYAWRVGQHLRVRYYGATDELIRATLLDSQGKEVATINRTTGFARAWAVFLGLFLVCAAVVIYRRDPQGTVESTDESSSGSQDHIYEFDDQPATEEELDEIKASVSRLAKRRKKQAMLICGAFVASCASVWPFLAGNPLHRYWDSVGVCLLFLSMVLLIPFAICLGLGINALIFNRNKRD